MTDFVLKELKASIRGAVPPLVICGAGVSMQATGGQAPSWAALIESGIDRAKDIAASANWAAYATERLHGNNAEAWITVADEVSDYLGGSGGGEFRRWLDEQFKDLRATDTVLLNALSRLGCPIATTNYDDVLSQGLGLPVINWTDHNEVALFLKGERKGILHLHGHWRKPETVILGKKSYDNLVGNTRRKLLQQLNAMTQPSLFVGCGADGLSDPDYEQLDTFLWEWRGSAERRFWLVRGTELEATKVSDPDRNLLAVSYGTQFDQLSGFLAQLEAGPSQPASERARPELRTIDIYEPEPKLFGRDAERDAIVGNLLRGEHVVISGAPGAGKTALAVAALYDARVRAKFGNGRLFVSLEGMEDARSIAASLADAMGLVASGDIPSLLRQIDLHSLQSPIVAILDNAEGVFENDYHESERVLNLLAQCASATLIVTLRGAVPSLAHSNSIDDLAKLELEDARRAFLEISGTRFAGDAHLDSLLIALDGHPLSIQLMAAQARALQRIQPLLESWEDERANILRLRGQSEERLTSVRASLALSLKTSTLQKEPFAKRLLAALELLPDGIEEDQVRDILGERSTLPRAKVLQAIAVVRELKLVEVRIDSRLRMLNPLRESLHGLVVPNAADRARVVNRGLEIARNIEEDSAEWAKTINRVDNEANNIETAISASFTSSLKDDVLDSLMRYSSYLRSSRRSIPDFYRIAIEQLIHSHRNDDAAFLMRCIATIYSDHSKYDLAYDMYKRALLYAKDDSVRSDITHGLAVIDGFYSRTQKSMERFKDGYLLAKGVNYFLGQANGLKGLGDLEIERGDLAAATKYLLDAKDLYVKSGSINSECSCVVHLSRIDPIQFKSKLISAMSRLETAGLRGTFASACDEMAKYYWRTGLQKEALDLFKKAKLIAQEAANIYNEGLLTIRVSECIRKIDGANSNTYDMLTTGFKLMLDVVPKSSAILPGLIALRSGLCSDTEKEREQYLGVAEMEWLKVGRPDVVREWIYFDQLEWPMRLRTPTPPPSATPQ